MYSIERVVVDVEVVAVIVLPCLLFFFDFLVRGSVPSPLPSASTDSAGSDAGNTTLSAGCVRLCKRESGRSLGIAERTLREITWVVACINYMSNYKIITKE